MKQIQFLILLFICIGSNAQQQFIDIEYAKVNDTKLLLDIYMPENVENPSLIIWIHGGAWLAGDKENPPMEFVKRGYALASVNYRLSGEAKFPGMLHDIKASIRFLRAKASDYGYKTDKIVIAGSSAGGHLVALVGVTNNYKELEGTIGGYLDESSSVQGIIDLYGPTNFMTILHQSTPHGMNVRVPALKQLLGDAPDNVPELAKLASPVFHVDSEDPPLLILHGNKDPQVPINQSHELENEYLKKNLPVKMVVVYEGVHGGDEFEKEKYQTIIFAFLDKIFE